MKYEDFLKQQFSFILSARLSVRTHTSSLVVAVKPLTFPSGILPILTQIYESLSWFSPTLYVDSIFVTFKDMESSNLYALYVPFIALHKYIREELSVDEFLKTIEEVVIESHTKNTND